MFIKLLDPAGSWLIDNETVYRRIGYIVLIVNDFILRFLFSFFFIQWKLKFPIIVHYPL